MTRNEFFTLLVPYLDGELPDEDVRRLEAWLAEDEEARSIVEYERRLSTFVGEALSEPVDPGAKLRVLRSFRDATAAPVQAASRPAGRKFSWRVAVPAAAAVILGLLWAGGFLGGDSGPLEHLDGIRSHRGVVGRVLVSYEDFQERVDTKRRPGVSYLKSIAEALEGEEDLRLWEEDSGSKKVERQEAARKLLSSCLQRAIDMPAIPADFKLLGFRRTDLELEGYSFPVPHLMFESEGEDLSMYVLCGSTADAVERELTLNDGKSVLRLHGCFECGVIARRHGNVLLLIVSRMPFNRIREVAEKM